MSSTTSTRVSVGFGNLLVGYGLGALQPWHVSPLAAIAIEIAGLAIIIRPFGAHE